MTTATAPAKTQVAVKPAPVGSIIDKMWTLREAKRKLEEQTKSITKEMDELEEELSARMDAEGMAKATGKNASVSYTETISATPQGEEGWAALYTYIAKKKYWHLLERRISAAAYREVLAMLNGQNLADLDLKKVKKQVPGTLPFTKKRLSLRALST